MIWLYIQRPIFCWISHILVNTLMPFFFLGPAQHKKSHPCWSSALCSYTFLVNWILLTPVWETLSRIKGFKDVEKCYNANIPLSFKYMFYPSTIISPNTINIINSPVLVLFNMFIVVFFTASFNHLLETENWGSVVFNIIK